MRENAVIDSPMFHAIMEEVDKRVDAGVDRAVSRLKLWLLTALLGFVGCGVAGAVTIVYHLGQLNQEFRQTLEVNRAQNEALMRRYVWMTRKDELDDSIVNFMRGLGYQPPEWYRGRDASETGS